MTGDGSCPEGEVGIFLTREGGLHGAQGQKDNAKLECWGTGK